MPECHASSWCGADYTGDGCVVWIDGLVAGHMRCDCVYRGTCSLQSVLGLWSLCWYQPLNRTVIKIEIKSNRK